MNKAHFTSSLTYTCLQNSGPLCCILQHINNVATLAKDGAVVIDIHHLDLHCDSRTQSRAASVRGDHLQNIYSHCLPVKPSGGGQGSCARVELEVSVGVPSWRTKSRGK